jgi:segregation and condensation protein A
VKSVFLPQFEGPLDLLLSLVRKEELDIADLPIAEVTRQYLNYLHEARQLDMDLGADFAYMAATLIHIKSRSLLPPAGMDGIAEPDLREDLVRELLSHEELKLASEFLEWKLGEASTAWSATAPDPEAIYREPGDPDTRADSMDLLQVFLLAKKALALAIDPLILEANTVTVAEMEEWLLERLLSSETGAALDAGPLFAEQESAERRIYLFLAMLETARANTIRLEQSVPFGPLFLQRINLNSEGER